MTQSRTRQGFRSIVLPMGTILCLCTIVGTVCFQAGDRSHDLRNPLLTPAIEMRADDDGLDDLRGRQLKDNDCEVRIWIEPMTELDAAEGYVIRRLSNSWSARHLLPREIGPAIVGTKHGVTIGPAARDSVKGKTNDVEPLNGWDFLWRNLTEAGLLTLPDEGSLPVKAGARARKGMIYVVETRTDTEYRTYRYTAPEQHDLPETKAMVRIIQVLRDEFSSDQKD